MKELVLLMNYVPTGQRHSSRQRRHSTSHSTKVTTALECREKVRSGSRGITWNWVFVAGICDHETVPHGAERAEPQCGVDHRVS